MYYPYLYTNGVYVCVCVCVQVAEVVQSMEELVMFTKNLSPGMASMTKQVDARTEDLTNPSHADILTAESDQVRLHCTLYIYNVVDSMPATTMLWSCVNLYSTCILLHIKRWPAVVTLLPLVFVLFLPRDICTLPGEASAASADVLHEGLRHSPEGPEERSGRSTREQVS